MSLLKTLDFLITSSFYTLFFLVPLILTPWNSELFEFNKMLLTYVLTLIITASWLIKMIIQRTIKIRRTPLDFPLGLFFLSQLLATIFSIHPYTSIWGYYSRSHGGLLSTISYLLLFYAFLSNFDKKNTFKALYFLLASGFLVAFYGILEHFGIDENYWVQDVRRRVFSTLGQPNWLAAWLTALAPLTWGFVLNSKLQRKTQNFLKSPYLSLFLYTIFFICLLFTKSRSGLIGFLFGGLVFFGGLSFSLTKIKKIKKKWHFNFKALKPYFGSMALILGLTFLISLLIGTEFTPSAEQIFKKFSQDNTPVAPEPAENQPPDFKISKSSDIRKVVWQGALDVWLDNPKTILLGDGVETFAYSYYNHRPQEHNLLSEWDFLYNKAHNEYLNFLANSGILGLGSYLSIIGVFIIWNLRKITNYELPASPAGGRITSYGFFAGYATILVTNFFGFSVVPVAILFFLYPAFAFLLTEVKPKYHQLLLKQITNYELPASPAGGRVLSYGFSGLILLFTLYSLLFTVSLWFADRYFAEGKNLKDNGYVLKGVGFFEKAVKFNQKEADFHAELAETAAQIATNLVIPEASPSAEVLIWQQKAIEETETAIRLNHVHLNILKSAARTYVRLANLDPVFLEKAQGILDQAIVLAPTEPRVRYNQALILNQMGRQEEAINLLEETVALKPDYREARFALALILKETGKIKEAEEQLNFILEKINPEDEAILKEMELLKP